MKEKGIESIFRRRTTGLQRDDDNATTEGSGRHGCREATKQINNEIAGQKPERPTKAGGAEIEDSRNMIAQKQYSVNR